MIFLFFLSGEGTGRFSARNLGHTELTIVTSPYMLLFIRKQSGIGLLFRF